MVILMVYKADNVKKEFWNSRERGYMGYIELNESDEIEFPIKVEESTFSYIYLVFGLVFVMIFMFITYPLAVT